MRSLPVLVLVLTLTAIAAVTLLEQHADGSRRAQLRIGAMNLALADLIVAPYRADPTAGGVPAAARLEIQADEDVLSRGLSSESGVEAPGRSLAQARASFAAVESVVATIYQIAARPTGINGNRQSSGMQKTLAIYKGQLSAVLDQIDQTEAGRAQRSTLEAAIGTAAAMLALAGVFLIFYVRSRNARTAAERLVRENQELLGASRVEASTDALTGLGNRRALTEHLKAAVLSADDALELLLAMFDLNGFKQYNDTFGHGAGDALLARLGGRLSSLADGSGSAYRMGGDEFCLLARCTPQAAEAILAGAATALSDRGEGWSIDCSYGAVWLPSEASTASAALLTADQRMYANKATRSSASRQLTDVLLQVLSEQDKSLDAHVSRVADLASRLAAALGQPDHQVERIGLAAKLHDVGKTAIPRAILNKPGPLNEHEWEFVRRHTLIGERIVLAAPVLVQTAPLVRSSHERIDGAGYPDGLRGEQIPIGSRIIAVCDAYDAMTSSTRPYRQARSADEALDELKRCAGTQFDAEVVHAFCAIAVSDSNIKEHVLAASSTRTPLQLSGVRMPAQEAIEQPPGAGGAGG